MTLEYDHFAKYLPVNKDTIGVIITIGGDIAYYVPIENFELDDGLIRLSKEYYKFRIAWDINCLEVEAYGEKVPTPILISKEQLTIVETNIEPDWTHINEEEALEIASKREQEKSLFYKLKTLYFGKKN